MRRITVTVVQLPIGEFVRYLAGVIGAEDAPLLLDQPLGRQLIVDSVRMVELAIVLEQELGIDLDDDLDLRGVTFNRLYERYTATAAAQRPAGRPAAG
jgi:acyl carrier protein